MEYATDWEKVHIQLTLTLKHTAHILDQGLRHGHPIYLWKKSVRAHGQEVSVI